MRKKINKNSLIVWASEADCEKFARTFPCANFFHEKPQRYIKVMAEFQSTGVSYDLVDLVVKVGRRVINSQIEPKPGYYTPNPEYPDESALSALIQDMEQYGNKR